MTRSPCCKRNSTSWRQRVDTAGRSGFNGRRVGGLIPRALRHPSQAIPVGRLPSSQSVAELRQEAMHGPPQRTIKSAAKRKGQKRLASPTSTGGAGVVYEARVQATYLLAMFAGSSTAVHPEAVVVQLQFQGRIHGFNTDDLICTLRLDDGSTLKALLQVKLTLRAVPSDSAFRESIGAAWYDYQNQDVFQRGRDRLVIVYSRDADGSIHAAGQLTHFARTSSTGAEFTRKATADGFSSRQQRTAFESVKTILGEEAGSVHSSDELHDFLRHVWFVNHLLANDETPELAGVLNHIKVILGTDVGGGPSSVWSQLTTTCQRLNKEAASLSLANLDAQVSAKLAAGFANHRNSPLARVSVADLTTEPPGVLQERASLSGIRGDVLALPGTPVRRIASWALDEVGLSAGRVESANRVITGQLDAITEKLKRFRYQDALDDVTALGRDLEPFDAHQKARWYLLRGVCTWHLGDIPHAAADFLRAAELYANDEKIAAAGVRGLLLMGNPAGAVHAGEAALQRFPQSLYVWAAYASARIVSGQALSESDVPPAHRAAADALQLLAASRQQAGDVSGAVAASLRSLDCQDAGFYTRAAALSTVLEAALANKVLASFRLVDAGTRSALQQVTEAFEPRTARLWNVQAPEFVAGVTANLGLALLLQDEPHAALALVREARAHGVDPPELLRVELEALLQTGDTTEMFSRGRSQLNRLPDDALVGLAQAAANVGDLSLVNDALATANRMHAEDGALQDLLCAIRWMAMWNAKERDSAQEEARRAGLETSTSLPLIAAGARVLRNSDAEIASGALARAENLVAMAPTPDNLLILADLLYDFKSYAQASTTYERVVPPARFSDLHKRLLHCYIRAGQRRKARKLIEQFPDGWVHDDDARALAIELGHAAGDWPLLKVLADAQFRREPGSVSSWLFKFSVAARELPASELQQWLSAAPLDLQGTIQQTAQLASLEMRYGLREHGMRRMYRLRRLNESDVESASALLLTFVSVPGLLPHMEESLSSVMRGTHFSVMDGAERIDITIDPAEVGDLPADGEYRNGDSPEVAPFIGKHVGDEVVVQGSFRIRRTLKIVSIGSAYRRLLDLARLQMDQSLGPVPNATSIQIRRLPNGEVDFSELHEQLKKQSAHAKEALSRYRTSPITLGGLGLLLGRNPVDIVRGWPTSFDAPALVVTAGTEEEGQKALAQLTDPEVSYVIDAATVAELVILGAADALRVLPKVYVTTETRDILSRHLEEAKLQRSSGTLLDDDGRMRLIEFTAEHHAHSIRLAQAMVDLVDSLCEVVPSYGPEANAEVFVELEKAISNEEHAVIRLAAERNLCLLTIDGRLRDLAALVQVPGVWPQALFLHALEREQLTQRTCSSANLQMFLSNRSFVSLGAPDLLMMCHQGTSWVRVGVAKYKRYLSDSGTEFKSAYQATLGFIYSVAGSCTYMAALAELLRHITEALLRHKDCPPNITERLFSFLGKLLSVEPPYPYPALQEAQQAEARAQLQYLFRALMKGQRWATESMQDRPIRLKVYQIGQTPWLVADEANDKAV